MLGRAFSKLQNRVQIAPELRGRLLRCSSHCIRDSNYLIMLEKLYLIIVVAVGIMFPASVQLNPVRALHDPDTGLTFASMVQWALKQSNKN